MKITRLPHIFIIACTLMLIESCGDDFLSKDPPGVVFEGQLANKDGLEKLLISVYAELDGLSGLDVDVIFESTVTNWVYGDVYADNAYKGSFIDDQPAVTAMEKYNQGPANRFFYFKWIAIYDGVSRCNDVIRLSEVALQNGSISEDDAIQFQAETRFLRGYYHLEAIKMWDFIPIVDESMTPDFPYIENHPSSNVEANAGNKPWGQLGADGQIPWDRVEDDFQFAINHLPESPRNEELGRATKFAALSLMGKVKWYQSDHESALNYFNQVIDDGGYALTDNFHDNFRASGDNNSEAIFQCQASVNDGFGGWNGNLGEAFIYPNIAGSFFQPSQNLVNAFKTTDGSVGGVQQGLPYLEAFNLDFNARGDDVISDADPPLNSDEPFTPDIRSLDPRLDWTVGRRGIPYLDWGTHPGKDWLREKNFYFGPYSAIKTSFYMSTASEYSQAIWGFIPANANNYSIIRYADLLLMTADCEVELGNLVRARELVNMVRGRMADFPRYWVKDDQGTNAANYLISRYPVGGISDPFQTVEGAKEAVQFERRLELALEGHRFWDLKKWGIAKKTLNDYAQREADKITYLNNVVFKDKNVRFPIFQEIIDRSNGTLKQVPGY